MSQPDIQVMHLATGAVGGAGLAARRLNAGLVAIGMKSEFHAPSRSGYITQAHEYELSRGYFARIKSAASTLLQKDFNKLSFFSLVSINSISVRNISKLGDKQNTVIHFHNWFNLVSQRRILKLADSGYKIVLTMHDERFFTGGCHYALDCEGFVKDCSNCPRIPRVMSEFPKRNLNRLVSRLPEMHSNIRYVAPSRWIAKEALRSKALANASIYFIPNSLGPTSLSTSIPNERSRRDNQFLKIGIASMDEKSYVKGGDVLSAVTKRLETSNSPIKFVYLNQIENELKFESDFWNEIDYLLLLSRADNSPNVIHEAKLRGIPVIATNIGGMPELLTLPPDLLLEEVEDSNSIAETLKKLHETRPDTALKLNESNEKFLNYIRGNLEKHVDLYRSMF